MNRILIGEKGFYRLADRLRLSDEERLERKKALNESFMPFKVTDYYADLIVSQTEPYRSQMLNIILPPVGKKKFRGRFDPYGNKNFRQENGFLQHKYCI